jgi:diguanylate cyclase (GGDEF)-like protein
MTRDASPTPSRQRLVRWLGAHAAHVVPMLNALAVVMAVIAGVLIALFGRHSQALVTAAIAGLVCAVLVPWCGGALLRLVLGPAAAAAWGQPTTQDELTGAHTRSHFMQLAEREFGRCRRYQTPGALLLVDADHFRQVNETHGWRCGDALLREITRLALESLRQADLLGRFGGEELILFLPHTDPLGALDVADRIRDRVSSLRLAWQGAEVRATVSIGVAALEPTHVSLAALIRDADTALFAAKEAGRNCVRAAPIEPRRSGETPSVTARR